MSAPRFVDTAAVRRRFAKIAAHYAQTDFLVREIDRRMQERLDYVRIAPGCILDLGASQGGSLPGLMQRYPDARLLAVDAVPAMLAPLRPAPTGWRRWLARPRAGAQPIAADAVNLPLAARSTALIWSNLLLHWLDDPLPALREAYRVLEVGGLLMFSTFGPDTLKELRAVFADGYAHTQRFVDMHDYGDMLVECGFADPVMDMEVLTLTYDDFGSLLRELRTAGGGCAMTDRRPGLMGRGVLARAEAAYEALRQAGKLPATFEVIYGHAWKAVPRTTADGRTIVRFERPPKGNTSR